MEQSLIYILQYVHQFDGNEDVKIIGTFSSYENAQQAFEQLSMTKEFRERLSRFHISAYEVDKIHWQEWEFPIQGATP